MKFLKQLFQNISEGLDQATLSPEFWKNVETLRHLMKSPKSNPHYTRAQQLLRIVDHRQFNDLVDTLRTRLSNGTLSAKSSNVNKFEELFSKFEKMMIAQRPRCFPEAKKLLEELRNEGIAKKPKVKKLKTAGYTTLEDSDSPRVHLIFGGAFEMNRKRH